MVFGVILVAGASLTACVLLVQVAVLPLLFRYSKTVQRKMIFANCINELTDRLMTSCSFPCTSVSNTRGVTDELPVKKLCLLNGSHDIATQKLKNFTIDFGGWYIVQDPSKQETWCHNIVKVRKSWKVNFPRNTDFQNPSSCNVMGGRNFNIDFESKVDNCPVRIGVWHIVPSCQFQKLFAVTDYSQLDSRLQEELKIIHNTIVLYCHGNSSHRGTPHRLQMYKVFQDLNFHVITFDYRGYGDSTHLRPTEKGLVEDTFQVYSWLMNNFDNDAKPTVILWGHSIGTSIAANLVAHMSELCCRADQPCLPLPTALVLESPFNNIAEEIEKHPFSKLVSWLPYYKDSFVKPYTKSSEYTLTTDEYLMSVTQLPILILHSTTDRIVPFQLGVKLHECIARSRTAGGGCLEFHAFDRGHNDMYESPDLPRVVDNFVTRVKKRE